MSAAQPGLLDPAAMIDGRHYETGDEDFAQAFPTDKWIWLDRDGREIADPAYRVAGACFALTCMDGEFHAYHRAEWDTGATFYFMGGGDPSTADMIVPEFVIHKRPAAH